MSTMGNTIIHHFPAEGSMISTMSMYRWRRRSEAETLQPLCIICYDCKF